MESRKEQITIRGILVPVDWDGEGNVIRIAIMAAKEEEYLVEENVGGRRLFGLIQREVEVRGVMREEASQKIITVQECRQTR